MATTISCKQIENNEYEITIDGGLVEVRERYFWGVNPNHNYWALIFPFKGKLITYHAEWWHGGGQISLKEGLYHINRARDPKFDITVSKKETETFYIRKSQFHKRLKSDRILLEILKSSGITPKNIIPQVVEQSEETTRPKNCHRRPRPFMPDEE